MQLTLWSFPRNSLERHHLDQQPLVAISGSAHLNDLMHALFHRLDASSPLKKALI
jgi:hypothetical protein